MREWLRCCLLDRCVDGCADRGRRAVRGWNEKWVYGQRNESSEDLE